MAALPLVAIAAPLPAHLAAGRIRVSTSLRATNRLYAGALSIADVFARACTGATTAIVAARSVARRLARAPATCARGAGAALATFVAAELPANKARADARVVALITRNPLPRCVLNVSLGAGTLATATVIAARIVIAARRADACILHALLVSAARCTRIGLAAPRFITTRTERATAHAAATVGSSALGATTSRASITPTNIVRRSIAC